MSNPTNPYGEEDKNPYGDGATNPYTYGTSNPYGQQPQAYGQPPAYGPPVVPYMQVSMTPPNAPGATASMVLGIISMFVCWFGWILGIIAIALASKAMKDVNASGGRLGGRGMAITGLVLGIIAVAAWLPWMTLGLVAALGSA